jgi:hypothetical protein
MREKISSKGVEENGDGVDVERVVQLVSGGRSEMVTNDLKTFSLL